jgi:hypothetical protein
VEAEDFGGLCRRENSSRASKILVDGKTEEPFDKLRAGAAEDFWGCEAGK